MRLDETIGWGKPRKVAQKEKKKNNTFIVFVLYLYLGETHARIGKFFPSNTSSICCCAKTRHIHIRAKWIILGYGGGTNGTKRPCLYIQISLFLFYFSRYSFLTHRPLSLFHSRSRFIGLHLLFVRSPRSTFHYVYLDRRFITNRYVDYLRRIITRIQKP